MDEKIVAALGEALDDEYKARATYRAVLERFGAVRPFVNIVQAEQRHIDALLEIYRKFDVRPPPDRWTGRVEVPGTIQEACQSAVQAEIENDVMYERLLADIPQTDIRAVMLRLQAASRDRHLPAFQRCVQRGGRGGMGASGQGPRNRGGARGVRGRESD